MDALAALNSYASDDDDEGGSRVSTIQSAVIAERKEELPTPVVVNPRKRKKQKRSATSSSSARCDDNDDDEEEQKELKYPRNVYRQVSRAAASAAMSASTVAAAPIASTSLAAASSSSLPHDGRVRTFAHVEGSWACHLFVPIYIDARQMNTFEQCCNQAEMRHQMTDGTASTDSGTTWKRMVPDLASSASISTSSSSSPSLVSASSCLHISLSRTFTLRYEQITPFLAELHQMIDTFMKEEVICQAKSTAQPNAPLSSSSDGTTTSLPLLFHNSKLYSNDEKTREFLALLLYSARTHGDAESLSNHSSISINSNLSSSSSSSTLTPTLIDSCVATHYLLLRLLKRIDRLLLGWGAPPYYESPELHASFAWRLPAAQPTTSAATQIEPISTATAASSTSSAASSSTPAASSSHPSACIASLRHLQCTIGKRQYRFGLTR